MPSPEEIIKFEVTADDMNEVLDCAHDVIAARFGRPAKIGEVAAFIAATLGGYMGANAKEDAADLLRGTLLDVALITASEAEGCDTVVH